MKQATNRAYKALQQEVTRRAYKRQPSFPIVGGVFNPDMKQATNRAYKAL